jgi:hypothetical protein
VFYRAQVKAGPACGDQRGIKTGCLRDHRRRYVDARISNIRRSTDPVGHFAAIAETDFEHMIARYHCQKSDSLRVCRFVGLVEPVCDRDTDLAFRVAKLPTRSAVVSFSKMAIVVPKSR